MSAFRSSLLAIIVLSTAMPAMAIEENQNSGRRMAKDKSLYFEYTLEMMSYIELAIGNKSESDCMIDAYYSSPEITLFTSGINWRSEELAPLIYFSAKNRCRGDQSPSKPNDEIWNYTNNTDDIIKELPAANAYAGIRMMLWHANIENTQPEAPKCIIDRLRDILEDIKIASNSRPSVSFTELTYEAVRNKCAYPKAGLPSSQITFEVDNAVRLRAAKVRLGAAQEFMKCDLLKDDESIKECLNKKIMSLAEDIVAKAAEANWRAKSDHLAVLKSGLIAFKEKNYSKSMEIMLPLAQKGDRTSQFYVGYSYANGLGVAINLEIARKWLQLYGKPRR